MKILITGGEGFIGGHLVDKLVKKNDVIVYDDESSGNYKNPKAFYRNINISNKYDTVEAFHVDTPDLIIHLAANTSVSVSIEDPLLDFEQSMLENIILISLAKERKTPIIFFSSGMVYGNSLAYPIDEEFAVDPESPYAIIKLTTEMYLQFYREVYGLPYIIVRPATVYGPRQKGGAVADYIKRLKNNQPVSMYGSGITRDYVYIDDVVDAVIKLMDFRFDGEIFNIGTGVETRLSDVYAKISKLLGKHLEPILLPENPAEVTRFVLSSEKLYDCTRWRPKVSLDQGLKLTV